MGLALVVWELVVLSGWKDEWILPGPVTVFEDLAQLVQKGEFWEAVATTARRAITGFAFAMMLGLLLGVAVSRSRILRTALGSFITGLQTMPSIAWFPLAIVLFQLSEQAIFFVVVLGAAPSIANGVISGVDFVPPVLVRAGRNLGARGLSLYRYVIGPASLPAIVAGLKQGWAFAWRSLMAGELLVVIPGAPAIGSNLQHARENTDYPGLISHMIVILIIGIIVDALFNSRTTGSGAAGALSEGGCVNGAARGAASWRDADLGTGRLRGAGPARARGGRDRIRDRPGRSPTGSPCRGSSLKRSFPTCGGAAWSAASAAPRAVTGWLGLRRRSASATLLRAVDGPLAGVRGERPETASYDGAAEHLQTVWVAVRAAVRSVLDEVSLADVLAAKFPPHVQELVDSPGAWSRR